MLQLFHERVCGLYPVLNVTVLCSSFTPLPPYGGHREEDQIDGALLRQMEDLRAISNPGKGKGKGRGKGRGKGKRGPVQGRVWKVMKNQFQKNQKQARAPPDQWQKPQPDQAQKKQWPERKGKGRGGHWQKRVVGRGQWPKKEGW